MRFLSFFSLLAVAPPLAAQPSDLAPGIAHYNARRWAEAQAFFARVTKAQPRNVEAVIWYGRTLLSESKPGDAEDWFEKATKLAPRSSEAHLWLGRAIGVQAATANPLRQPFLARRLKHAVDRAIELDPRPEAQSLPRPVAQREHGDPRQGLRHGGAPLQDRRGRASRFHRRCQCVRQLACRPRPAYRGIRGD